MTCVRTRRVWRRLRDGRTEPAWRAKIELRREAPSLRFRTGVTHSRVQPLRLSAALLAALGVAWWQHQHAAAAVRAGEVAVRELHASEVLLQAAKRAAAAADQRKAEVTKAIEARHVRGAVLSSQVAAARPLSGSALVRQQTTDLLRGRPEIMAAAQEAAVRRIRWQYGPLMARLGVSPQQAEQIETLLVQRDGISINNYQLQPVDAAQTAAANAELRQLLGDSGYAQLTAFTSTLSVRTNVARLAANLSQIEPLPPDVAEKLVQAGADALQQKIAASAKAGASSFGFFPDEALLPTARALLTPRQFETFKLLVEQETGRKVGGS